MKISVMALLALAAAAVVALPSTDPLNIPGTAVQYTACHAANSCPGPSTGVFTVFGPAHYADPYMTMLSRGDNYPAAGHCNILADGCHYNLRRSDLDALCYHLYEIGCIRYWRDASGGEHKVPATGQAVTNVIFPVVTAAYAVA
ncbi:MAG: hypothetical protein M1826_004428 [Phylliscum demangeonii]|nr:MAG: hypothetical protein M1826_004428 [Phylliscum demangeonii]